MFRSTAIHKKSSWLRRLTPSKVPAIPPKATTCGGLRVLTRLLPTNPSFNENSLKHAPKILFANIRTANCIADLKTGQNTTSEIEYLGIMLRRLFNAYTTTQYKLCRDIQRAYLDEILEIKGDSDLGMSSYFIETVSRATLSVEAVSPTYVRF